jgi:hypothetical protein
MVNRLYAVAAVAVGLLGCTPMPTLSPPARMASAPCQQGNKCTVQIYFDAQGNPSVDIDEIVVSRANSHMWWVLLDKGCSFVASTGVLLKDPNGDPSGQFDQKYVADDSEQQLQLGQHGARYHWRDKYLAMGSTQYELNFTCNGRYFHIDPSIKNGN